jgi:hypothetical protein
LDSITSTRKTCRVVYDSFGFLPATLVGTPSSSSFATRTTLLITVDFGDPTKPNQLSYNETSAYLLSGINTTGGSVITDRYANLVETGDVAYPHGSRRQFYGPQTTTIDSEYLANLTDTFNADIKDLQQDRGKNSYSHSFVMQYMFIGLDGHLLPSDSPTSWPHAVAGHQTLFTPAYLNASDDGLTLENNAALNQITYDRQNQSGELLGDYPDYISPNATGHRVCGDNVHRLMDMKQTHDPECLDRNGKVFASAGCVAAGYKNACASRKVLSRGHHVEICNLITIGINGGWVRVRLSGHGRHSSIVIHKWYLGLNV